METLVNLVKFRFYLAMSFSSQTSRWSFLVSWESGLRREAEIAANEIVYRLIRPCGQMLSYRSRLFLRPPQQHQFHQQNFLAPDRLQILDYYGYPHLSFGHLCVLGCSTCHPGKLPVLLYFANGRRCQQSRDLQGLWAHPLLFSMARHFCRADEVFHWILPIYSFFDNLNYNR